MPKTKTFLTPAEYAVLGLLREKPAYGYELQRQLSGRRGLGRVSPIEPAMVYAILKSLSGLELIDGAWDNSAYPPKAIYTPTETGQAEFERWLRRPVGRMREIRHDFLIKLHFAMKEGPELAHDILNTQIEMCREYATEIAREHAEVELEGTEFDVLVLESKATAVRITIEWLEACLDRQRTPLLKGS